MFDLIIIAVIAFAAGGAGGYLIFPGRLLAIERALITVGLGIAIFALAFFGLGGFEGVKGLRYNRGLLAAAAGAVAIVVLGLHMSRKSREESR